MRENFWTVERLSEIRRVIEEHAELVEGESYKLVRIDKGLSKCVWKWLHASNSSLKIDLSEANSGLTLLKKMKVISGQLQSKGPQRYYRHFYPGVEIDEEAVAIAYQS